MELKDIEFWEKEYLEQIYYLILLDKEKMLNGLATKDEIKYDWRDYIDTDNKRAKDEISRGAERIFYWIFNQFGKPNSSPIGADMFFETYNAYIHIDVKTVLTTNKGDFKHQIAIQRNQTSYKGNVIIKKGENKGEKRYYNGNLPTYYSKENGDKKICLTYFINLLYDPDSLEVQIVLIACMPNGELNSIYDSDILKAGKNIEKTRFTYKGKGKKFKLLDGEPSRIKVVYFNENMDQELKTYFSDLEKLYNKQNKRS